jgi:hypothetical protein
MIGSSKNIGIFYGNDISYAFHNANNGMVSHIVAAYITQLVVRNIMTIGTKLYFISHLANGIAKMNNFITVLL